MLRYLVALLLMLGFIGSVGARLLDRLNPFPTATAEEPRDRGPPIPGRKPRPPVEPAPPIWHR